MEGWGGGALGVRRPLRFLAWKLELRDDQVQQLAAILDELKTERAQAEVDQRRSLGVLADVIGTEVFDATRAAEASRLRNESTHRLQDAVIKALGRMHALLEPEQRQRLAYLIRTGAVML
jgi:Spy/CpxP family protein refolding chaperone